MFWNADPSLHLRTPSPYDLCTHSTSRSSHTSTDISTKKSPTCLTCKHPCTQASTPPYVLIFIQTNMNIPVQVLTHTHTAIQSVFVHVVTHRHVHAYQPMQALMHILLDTHIPTYMHETNCECMQHTRNAHVCMFLRLSVTI